MSVPLEFKSGKGAHTSPPARLRLLIWTFLPVCFLYLVQLWTPLRLNGDAVVLLSVASSAADGHGFLDHGKPTHYPPGYPAMVVGLERVGAARPWGLVGLNALFLCIGFASAAYVARHYFRLSRDWAGIALLFAALDFALIKHFTLPLTDIPFFGISMFAVALLVRGERERGPKYYVFWAAALSTSAVGVLVRPVSIALFPCLLWSLGAHLSIGEIVRLNKRLIVIGLGVFSGIVFVVAVLLLHTRYVQEGLSVLAHQGLARGLRNTLLFRVHEIGELCLNAPAGRLGSLSPLVWIFGATAIVGLARYLRYCRLGFAEVYLAAYTLMMFVWPYGDTRFWTPVLPLIFAELFALARPWEFTGWKRRAIVLYAAVYVLMGFAALGYSSWITFSGREFPHRYGDGYLRSTYELLYSDPGARRSIAHDERALEVLDRYSRKSRE